jgi:pyridoxine 5-phosphate synthase
MLDVAVAARPDQVTLVPENRQEITTEGGLDVAGQRERVAEAVRRLHEAGIVVSLFLDPDAAQIRAAKELQVAAVELHTGQYALAAAGPARDAELAKLSAAGRLIVDEGMVLHAGHGLTYHNVIPIAALPAMHELNIGHSIVSRGVLVGMERAVREMKELITAASRG